MSMTQDEKDLLNEKFLSIHNEIVSGNNLINQKLDTLNETVLRQNSRIGKLETFKENMNENILPTRITPDKFECVVKEINGKIDKIEKDFSDVSFYLRHPKLFVAGLIVIIALSLGAFLTNNPLKVFDKSPQTEQTK